MTLCQPHCIDGCTSGELRFRLLPNDVMNLIVDRVSVLGRLALIRVGAVSSLISRFIPSSGTSIHPLLLLLILASSSQVITFHVSLSLK